MVLDQYDVWLFDLDGTLVDAEWRYIRDTFDRVGERLGRRFTDRQATELWYGLDGRRDHKLREWGVDPDEFWPEFHAVEDPETRAAASFLHQDAGQLIREVNASGRRTGIVTHCAGFLADPVIDQLGIRSWFDVILPCSTETGWKPDPEPVYRALTALNVAIDSDALDGNDPAATDVNGVLVGDGTNDVGAAWNAGLDAVHVERHGHERRGRCVLADYRVEALDTLSRSTETVGITPDGQSPSQGDDSSYPKGQAER